jgi:transposase-like protein
MLTSLRCPHCLSENIKDHSIYQTKNNGPRTLHQCMECHRVFSETKGTFLEGLRTPVSFIIRVLTSRTEGMGFNAACRVFGISKDTLQNWEQLFAGLKVPLLIYSLLHTFLTQLIEGDESYTKVGKNLPPEDSEGWTIILMERASRFIWTLTCGKKDKGLFLSAIQTVSDVIRRTGDVTLVTDGERRYSNILFEICSE